MATKTEKIDEKTRDEFQDLWDRVGYIEITIGDDEPMVFKGLDFKFHVTKVLADMVEGNMRVDIHGLTQDTMNKIVTVCNQQEAIARRKVVKVYAGYRNPNDDSFAKATGRAYEGDMIACMDILYASVTSPPPELWVTIEGCQSAFYRFINFKFVKEGEPKPQKKTILEKRGMGVAYRDVTQMVPQDFNVIDLCEDFVECANKAFENAEVKQRLKFETYITKETAQKTVSSFHFEGDMSQITAKIGTEFDVFCYMEQTYGGEDVLVIMDKPEDLVKQKKLLELNNLRKKEIRTKYLDVNRGLIGIPSISNATCLKCRCLLDPKLTVGDYIHIKSVLMPVVDNQDLPESGWQINKITFSGHMRGTEWYCDITAVNPLRLTSTDEEGQTPKKTYILRDDKTATPISQ